MLAEVKAEIRYVRVFREGIPYHRIYRFWSGGSNGGGFFSSTDLLELEECHCDCEPDNRKC